METFGWQRFVNHDARIEADLTLCDEHWARPLQSGFRPNWRVVDTAPEDPMEGPVLLEGARSAAPGARVRVTIVPIFPDRWSTVEIGSQLEMLDRRERVVGKAIVTALHGTSTPASN